MNEYQSPQLNDIRDYFGFFSRFCSVRMFVLRSFCEEQALQAIGLT